MKTDKSAITINLFVKQTKKHRICRQQMANSYQTPLPPILQNMKKTITISFFNESKPTFAVFQKYLKHQTDRKKVLNETANHLLHLKNPNKRQLAFKNKFFETYACELASNTGCSEVLPDHLRIQTKARVQFLIEIMNATRKAGYLGDITIKRLARILVCILDTDYDQAGMVNRLKNPQPEYGDIYIKVEELAKHITKNI